MATKKSSVTTSRQAAAKLGHRIKKSKSISISSDLRKAYPWFDELIHATVLAAKMTRKNADRKLHKKLEPQRLKVALRALDKLQRELDFLEIRRKRLAMRVIAHGAHTMVDSFPDELIGETLLTTSGSIVIDQDVFRALATPEQWSTVTEPRIIPERLMNLAEHDMFLRELIQKSARVERLTVSVIPPVSRRAKRGRTEGGAE